VLVWKGQHKLSLRKNDDLPPLGSFRSASLYPHTQHRYQVRLDRYYDLSALGAYSVQAQYGGSPAAGSAPARGGVTSQEFTISVTNAPPQ
jgi:hypothetical protein